MNMHVQDLKVDEAGGLNGVIRTELSQSGLRWLGQISWNEAPWRLVQKSISRQEARLSATGALVVETGAHTGRSPKDKYIVLDETTARDVWWDNNRPMRPEQFAALKSDMQSHAWLKDVFVQDLEACPASDQTLPVRLVAEQAWAALFLRNLLKPALATTGRFVPALTILCLPTFKADPTRHGTASETVIALDLTHGEVLIAGTAYAGEMKKAVFTVLNYILPQKNILPMHCSVNVGAGGDTAMFFGLSGTGKTTLSADASRQLIGDDEHGWGNRGVFNIEHGCYAKAINLDALAEPEIFAASLAFGSVLENVVLDEATGEVDFTDSAHTENTRAAYGLDKIKNAVPCVMAAAPDVLIMLTADAFGVLPAVAVLDAEQAVEQFLIGYTAKLAGTERGVTTPQTTFSACFGAPFLPRAPQVYADLLKTKINGQGTRCYLLNTGWTGGAYGVGQRMKLSVTRKLLQAIYTGEIDRAEQRIDPNFGLSVPRSLVGIDAGVLNPRAAWADGAAYDVAAADLAQKFAAALTKIKAAA
jgi:phosphoenolpyruvate carboxykinase (ATP)